MVKEPQAPRLFLEAYMNAAKAMGYPQLMSFWQRVSGNRYSREELLKMKEKFRNDLLGYVNIEPATFDWFKTHMEAYSTTDNAREFESAAVEDSALRSDLLTGYVPAQPPNYNKHKELGGV